MSPPSGIEMTELQPGPPDAPPQTWSPYEANAWAMGEGKRYYEWFNCHGCHAQGGGDIGPPLMDGDWVYGGDPANIYASIVEGRPNGMPSFRGRIPNQQVWQIVAYVRSMSGLVPNDAAPGRSDGLSGRLPEMRMPRQQPPREGAPR